jgi:hypothetical protein
MSGFLSYNGKIMKKPEPLLNNLVSYWSFDVNVNDIHGINNGNNNGATLETGKINNCFSFDGVDDYIKLNNDILMQSNKTISMWLYLNSAKTHALINQGGVSNNRGWYFAALSDMNLRFTGSNTSYDSGLRSRITTNSPLSLATWHHVVLVFDSSNQEAYFYVDGVLCPDDGGVIYSSYNLASVDANIGTYNDTNGTINTIANGLIDEVGIWDRLLTEDEIKRIYNNGNGLEYNKFRYGSNI